MVELDVDYVRKLVDRAGPRDYRQDVFCLFGRFAEKARKRRGEGKPETFDFLGFTHSCGKTAKGNWFTIRRQTAKKRLRSKLQAVKQELGKRLAQAGGRERE